MESRVPRSIVGPLLCVCTLTLTVQDRPRHPPFLPTLHTKKHSRRLVLCRLDPLTFVFACRVIFPLFFFIFPFFLFSLSPSPPPSYTLRMHLVCDLSITAHSTSWRFRNVSSCNFAAACYYPNIRMRRGTNRPYGCGSRREER